jgi:hypothetical protein
MLYSEYRRECDETKKKGPTIIGTGKGKDKQGKVYDKVKNKIYLKRTQLLRGFPGRESVCLGKYARVYSWVRSVGGGRK